ncbi:MAG: flagellar basal body rod C-terminal domain-containing protein, partial [Bacilli bacterium]
GTSNMDGDGSNALALANLFNSPLDGLGKTSVKDFYRTKISQMGIDSQEAQRMAANSAVLLKSVNTRRLSVSSVSMDEEMVDLVRFQHAYNAAARTITIADEMLDKIINGMGVGGR